MQIKIKIVFLKERFLLFLWKETYLLISKTPHVKVMISHIKLGNEKKRWGIQNQLKDDLSKQLKIYETYTKAIFQNI
jgi:hypothetical protein